MATLDNQQQWVPYETTKDCSQGFCSIYCPQWCYTILPPPPPTGFNKNGSATTFSPLVIAIIGILTSAFLLVSYFTIISNYCGSFHVLRRRLHHHSTGPDDEPDEEDPSNQSLRHEVGWHVSPSNGLDKALINKITVYRFKRGDGLVDWTDCSVCLGEFMEDDSLRLLPKCGHAFHLGCIDTWLRFHSNCPVCRANIMSKTSPALPQSAAPPPPPPPPPLELAANTPHEMVIAIEDRDMGREGEGHLENNECDASEDPSHTLRDSVGPEESSDIIEIEDNGERSISMDSLCHDRVSIADVLRMSMEDEFLVVKDWRFFGSAGWSRQCGWEHSKSSSRSRALHCVMRRSDRSPVVGSASPGKEGEGMQFFPYERVQTETIQHKTVHLISSVKNRSTVSLSHELSFEK